ncbi:MAG: DUF3667 domain-containing protein [Blastomonas sp.]
MSSEIDAVGTIAEGAMLSRALEKRAGEAGTDDSGHGECLNCQTVLTGPYCHACGQSAHIHRSISAFWHDILHGVLHFDGKFWRTLPLLAWHPGKLTRRYVHGERARFISPMALFLFAIFMMFAIFSYVGSPDFDGKDVVHVEAPDSVMNGDWSAGLRVDAEEMDRNIAEMEQELAGLPASEDTAEREALEKEISDAKRERNGMSYAMGQFAKYPDVQGANSGSLLTDNKVNLGWPEFDQWATKALKKANANPDLLLYKLQSNGYKFAWLLIPLSIPFVWLATIGVRGHRFYDHAVFTTYSIAFMSLLFILVALATKFSIASGLVTTLAVLYIPFHMYRQLRHAYGLTRFGTFIRLSVLMVCILFVLIAFFAILLTLGVAG